jgi:hypothetical protein
MHWGVFESETGVAHIIPCTKAGVIERPHIVHVSCSCKPLPDPDTSTRLILVHNDPEVEGEPILHIR